MKDLSFFQRIYLARDFVDFRKQAHGLALLTKHILQRDPMQDKVLFVFTNRRKSAVKLLYWDQTGYALWSKVLERDRYAWPKAIDGSDRSVSVRELKWLLEGVDLSKIKGHEKVILY